ncbi:hypothetical protein [Planctomicrobium sp. SH664]|uniref:hypothetical protein n=1 Tax=Planctomicrobium sp. SH664 TaxID=3448125 RepID=UPI003F5B570E
MHFAPRIGNAWLCVLLSFAFLTGCGRGGTVEVAKVSGQVTLDGKPIPKAIVQFSPVSGRSSYAETDADGRYQLTYTARQPGALLGQHRVRITTAGEVEVKPGETYQGKVVQGESVQSFFTPEILPKRYNADSTLTANVEPVKENVIDFHLTSK